MGLMLSLLVVCVGVIEALSCFEHFQYGVLHCATNVYERARRRSSVFLKYTSRRLKLLSENSISEHEEQPDINAFEPIQFDSGFESQQFSEAESDQFVSLCKPKPIRTKKKLEKEDKIEIVKNLLERPRRPKTVRSISMPELVHTEEDIELSKIINELAIEPIQEIEDVNSEVLSKEFDELFNEYENSQDPGFKRSPLDDFQEENPDNLDRFEETKSPEPEVICDSDGRSTSELKINEQNLKHDASKNDEDIKNSQQLKPPVKDEKNEFFKAQEEKPVVIRANISERVSDKGSAYFQEVLNKRGSSRKDRSSRFDRSTSVDFSKVTTLMINKPATANLEGFSEKSNDSSELIPGESISHNKLEDIIFESDTPPVEVIDKTFDEIYEDICDESVDITNTFEEIEKNILGDVLNMEAESSRQSDGLSDRQPNPTDETSLGLSSEKTISNAVFLKAVEQLAELLVRDSLNLHKFKNLLYENINNLNCHEKINSTENDRKFGTCPQGQLEDEIMFVEDTKPTPKESVCSAQDVSNTTNLTASESIISEEKPLLQELSNGDRLREEKAKAFSTTADVTDYRQPVEEQLGTGSEVVIQEKSNLSGSHLELGSEIVSERLENEHLGALCDVNAVEVTEVPAKGELPKEIEDNSKSDVALAKGSMEETFHKEIPKDPPESGGNEIIVEGVKEPPHQPNLSGDCNAPVELPIKSDNLELPKETESSKADTTVKEGNARKDFQVEIFKESPDSGNNESVAENIKESPHHAESDKFSGECNAVVECPVKSDDFELPKETENSKADTSVVEGDAKDLRKEIFKAESKNIEAVAESIKESPHHPELDKSSGENNAVVEFPVKSDNFQKSKETESSKADPAVIEEDVKKDLRQEIFKAPPESKNVESVPESTKEPPHHPESDKVSGECNAVVEFPADNFELPKETKSSKVDTAVEEDMKKDFQKEIFKAPPESGNKESVAESIKELPPPPTELEKISGEFNAVVESIKESTKEPPHHPELDKSSGECNAVVEFPVKSDNFELPKETESSKADPAVVEEDVKKDLRQEIFKAPPESKNIEAVAESIKEPSHHPELDKSSGECNAVVESIKESPHHPESDKLSGECNAAVEFPVKSDNLELPKETENNSKTDVTLAGDTGEDFQKEIHKASPQLGNIEIVAERLQLSANDKTDEDLAVKSETKVMPKEILDSLKLNARNVEENFNNEIPATSPLSGNNETLIETVTKLPEEGTMVESNKTVSVTPTEEEILGEEENFLPKEEQIGDLKKLQEDKPLITESSPQKKESKSEIGTERDLISDTSSDITKEVVEPKPVLALECKSERKNDGNKEGEKTTEENVGQNREEISSGETVQPIETAEQVLLKAGELEENVKFEQVGTVDSTLIEESRSGAVAAGPVSGSAGNKDEHSENSKNSKENKATSSEPEAFWLIFSGEYTKAMSKDWHSGHFSCWQCDEALTGQRYVLRDDHPYCIKCYESVFANVCEECNKIIGIDSKDLSYKDKHWHEACFLCNKCRVSLVDKQFGSKADKIYCGNCYDAQFASRCDGCGEIFRAGTKKMEYKTRQWHEKCFCCCVCKTPIGTKSFIPREQEIYCATCYEEKFATRCVKCNKIITSGGVTYKNEPWHRECFTCTNCNTSLAGQRFTSRDEKPYCADCFGELFAKRCTACSRPITGIGGTRFISFEDRHWHNDCFICASCKTSLVGRGFITDGDDIICPECAKQKLM